MLNEGKGGYLETLRSRQRETLKTLRGELAHKDRVLRQLQQEKSDALSLHSQLSNLHGRVATLTADNNAQLADLTQARSTIEAWRADVMQHEQRERFVAASAFKHFTAPVTALVCLPLLG